MNASAWPRDDSRSVTVLVIMLSKNAPAWLLTIPDSVTSIGDQAFYNAQLGLRDDSRLGHEYW